MKILFLGTPQSAVPILETLSNSDHQVVGVVSQPARKKGRGQDLTESEVSAYAKSNKLPIFTPEKITKEYFDKHLVELKADIAIVVAFGQILPQDILDKIKFGWVNIHFSVLPDLRGAAPIQRAIMQGKTDLGVTVFKIDEGLDTGPIISQILYKRESSSNYQKTLHDLTEIAANNIVSIMKKYEAGQLIT
ncbi:MAG: methionyl-tRNA formyltransferase, partial [Candidatus Nanopelagicales bacterium]|nr:methionyl-tRNA formyltransferase [Candidatus Nanopelagicales bacterium]